MSAGGVATSWEWIGLENQGSDVGEECSVTVPPCIGYSRYRLRNKMQACQLGYMCICHTVEIPLSKMVAVERVSLLLPNSWVPGSNLSPDTDHQKLLLKLLCYFRQMLGWAPQILPSTSIPNHCFLTILSLGSIPKSSNQCVPVFSSTKFPFFPFVLEYAVFFTCSLSY